jgi:ABC-type glycerol-3-phosphate transport system substrate-binding protein
MNAKRFVFGFMALGFILMATMAFASGGDEGSASDKPMEITWMAQYKEAWAYEFLEEKFNVDLIPNEIYVNDKERREVMLAAGEFPDAGPGWADTVQMYEDGVIRPISIEMIRKYAPDISALNDRYPLAWIANSNPENRDEMLALNGISTSSDFNIFMPMMRADWVAKVGASLPGYEENKISLDRFGRVYFLDIDITLDQYEDLLYAFKTGDPDGNGKNDTIPYGASNNLWRSFHALAGSFGVLWGDNRYYNGTLVTYQNDPGMKDLIRTLAKWFKDGLIDNEFVSQDLRKSWDKIVAGQIGTTAEVLTYAGQPYAMDRPPNSWVSDDELGQPGAEVVIIPPPIGPNGDQGARSYTTITPNGGYKFWINAKVDDTKAAKILEIVNYARATEEGFVHFQYGKPGVHFDWEGDAWDSKPISRKAVDVPDGYTKQGFWGVYPPYYPPERLKFVVPKAQAIFMQEWLTAERGQSLSYRPARFDILNETDLPDIKRNYQETMDTLFEEFFFKAVTGEINVDAEWDNYVSTWLKNGGAQTLEALEKAPLVSGLLKGDIEY